MTNEEKERLFSELSELKQFGQISKKDLARLEKQLTKGETGPDPLHDYLNDSENW